MTLFLFEIEIRASYKAKKKLKSRKAIMNRKNLLMLSFSLYLLKDLVIRTIIARRNQKKSD